MKTLTDLLKEELLDGTGEGIAQSIGDMKDSSNYATPGNTMGMGNAKFPTPETPGSGDLLGKTRKEKEQKKKKGKCTKDEKEKND